jgi:hypothetical protein
MYLRGTIRRIPEDGLLATLDYGWGIRALTEKVTAHVEFLVLIGLFKEVGFHCCGAEGIKEGAIGLSEGGSDVFCENAHIGAHGLLYRFPEKCGDRGTKGEGH